MENYSLSSLICDTAQLNMMRIGSKPIEFDLHVDERTPAILAGDKLWVREILNNILSNAFKYTTAGSVTMTVSSKALRHNAHHVSYGYSSHNNQNTYDDTDKMILLTISVSDTGQGMRKEQVERLFDDNSRHNFEANQKTEGSGLGMSITNNLIRKMNGHISIKSKPGKGSTFTVHLPQCRVGYKEIGRKMSESLHQMCQLR